ncbi:hypothetical protein DES41_101439 [Pseudorhodoferax soli]|uniref:Uncharacterized protein n=1 Tax=Pseudorhodoferax soli TaxID=545864 RepID=A0A368Y915_9BURK|nr:hypothetical protein DES41_101439 [Pseudorhodoferax soli]
MGVGACRGARPLSPHVARARSPAMASSGLIPARCRNNKAAAVPRSASACEAPGAWNCNRMLLMGPPGHRRHGSATEPAVAQRAEGVRPHAPTASTQHLAHRHRGHAALAAVWASAEAGWVGCHGERHAGRFDRCAGSSRTGTSSETSVQKPECPAEPPAGKASPRRRPCAFDRWSAGQPPGQGGGPSGGVSATGFPTQAGRWRRLVLSHDDGLGDASRLSLQRVGNAVDNPWGNCGDRCPARAATRCPPIEHWHRNQRGKVGALTPSRPLRVALDASGNARLRYGAGTNLNAPRKAQRVSPLWRLTLCFFWCRRKESNPRLSHCE